MNISHRVGISLEQNSGQYKLCFIFADTIIEPNMSDNLVKHVQVYAWNS